MEVLITTSLEERNIIGDSLVEVKENLPGLKDIIISLVGVC
jgi:hypothetical protein